jgi:phosphate:Na+ symporter
MLIIIQIAGGIGLFLLGMIVMTEGLSTLAGSTIRTVLMRFTRSPSTGALTGAVSTAVLQSSSATTVAAVGFVAAELITYPEALGIILGANIGTTFTGWMVAILGFKLSLGNVFAPLIFLGAILRLFTKGRIATIGVSIAGFGLIFVAIGFMQQSMGELQTIISFESLPSDTISGRLLLVGIGIVFTIITQSSSAGVVAALTALFANLINFNQAAALVIGMDIGTTTTAVLATIGGSAAARRTGYSHVIYNLLTATGAFILITPYTMIWDYAVPGGITSNAEIALVAFHTSFNVLGVLIILPFSGAFARFMQTLIPDKVSLYTTKLDPALLESPGLALNSVQGTIKIQSLALFRHVNAILGDGIKGKKADLDELQSALNETHSFVDRISFKTAEDANWERLVQMIHTLDHMQRLHERCEEEEDRAITARETEELREECALLIQSITEILSLVDGNKWVQAAKLAKETSKKIHAKVRPFRASVMSRVARGEIYVNKATNYLEAIRWLRRVSRHVQRICEHVEKSFLAAGEKEF